MGARLLTDINADGLYLSAEDAAAALGVNVTTIYAYVSRGLIRSHKPSGSRTAKYWRADIDRVRLKQPTPAEPGPDVLVRESQITVLTEQGPFYRGRSALVLAETESLEAVASLLWQVDEAATFGAEPPKAPESLGAYWPLLETMGPSDRAIASFPLLERENPRAFDLTPTGFTRSAVDVMRWFAAFMTQSHLASAEPLHIQISRGAPEGGALQDAVRRLLVLSADHELDPTTYAVRAVANAGVNPYRIVIAGLVAATGRRLSYGRVDTLSRLLEEILTAADPKEVVLARIREGEPLPGFGSRLYDGSDPRANALLASLNHSLDGDRDLARFNAAAEVVLEVTDLHPDFALVNLFLGRKLGPAGQGGLALRLGRMAGWIAHAMEQYHGRDLVRPHAIYNGVLPNEQPEAPSARGRRAPRRAAGRRTA